MTFLEFWQHLHSHVHAGDEVRNWTAARGYLGDTFKVIAVENNYILVKAPQAKTAQRARREDFELIFRNWPDYVAGRLQRKSFMADTRVSKYTISIINQLQGENS